MFLQITMFRCAGTSSELISTSASLLRTDVTLNHILQLGMANYSMKKSMDMSGMSTFDGRVINNLYGACNPQAIEPENSPQVVQHSREMETQA
jgi:hypothetical protein